MDREKVIKKAERIMCSTVDRDMIDSFCEDVIALLEEQEKLINVDKLREKLGFAENCDKCTRDSWKCGKDSFFSLTDFCSMLDIAIEELIQEGR